MPIPRQLSFFDLATRYNALSHNGGSLRIACILCGLGGISSGSRSRPPSLQAEEERTPPFETVLMLKSLVLQALYNFSDDQTEYQIRDRFSFMRFL